MLSLLQNVRHLAQLETLSAAATGTPLGGRRVVEGAHLLLLLH